jgi:hypothetical protein
VLAGFSLYTQSHCFLFLHCSGTHLPGPPVPLATVCLQCLAHPFRCHVCGASYLPPFFVQSAKPLNASTATDLLSFAFSLVRAGGPTPTARTYIGAYRDASSPIASAGWSWVDNTPSSALNCGSVGCGPFAPGSAVEKGQDKLGFQVNATSVGLFVLDDLNGAIPSGRVCESEWVCRPGHACFSDVMVRRTGLWSGPRITNITACRHPSTLPLMPSLPTHSRIPSLSTHLRMPFFLHHPPLHTCCGVACIRATSLRLSPTLASVAFVHLGPCFSMGFVVFTADGVCSGQVQSWWREC